MPLPPPTILYVTGWCRSGSTVLGNVLAELPDVFHAGELHFLWANGVLGTGTNSLCGCGSDLRACPVWSEVLAARAPGLDGALADRAAELVSWQDARFRTRHTWRVLRTRPAELGADPYVRALGATYAAIREVTGARVIIDTSKYASEAAALRALEGWEHRVLHMVRDPRGVAYSWKRRKEYIPARGPVDSTLNWLAFNVAAEAVGRRAGDRALRLRYEELVAHPRECVSRVLALAGLDPAMNPVDADGVAVLGPHHTVTGNPDRFRTGPVRLQPDEAWRGALPARDRRLVKALALPLGWRYGYR